MATNATDLYLEMVSAICSNRADRTSSDSESPNRDVTVEAMPFSRFSFAGDNVVTCRLVDLRWAVANLLHFFADTDEGAILRKYNDRADRFLTGDKWVGAYGKIAMLQIRNCIEKLRKHRSSRRAIVSMGEMLPEDINRPACWSLLHFLRDDNGCLNMHVYQRSLSLNVMPYDLVVLSNILNVVSDACAMYTGDMWWTIGSLHAPSSDIKLNFVKSHTECYVDTALLLDPERCWKHLTGLLKSDHAPLKWLREEGLVQ